MLPSPSSVSLSLDTFSLPGEGIYGRAFSAYLAVLASFRSQPRLLSASNYVPQGSGQRSWTQGLAKPDKRGKQEANGGKLAFIRAVQAFTCPAEWPGPLPVFIQLTFTSQTGSLLLSSLKKVTFPPSSLSPPSVTSSPAPDRPRCSAGTHPPACPRRESGASGAFAARTAG